MKNDWISCRVINQCFIPELRNCKRQPFLCTYETATGRRYVKEIWICNGRIEGKESRIIAYMPFPQPYEKDPGH